MTDFAKLHRCDIAFGVIVCLLSASALALGIIDVVMTYLNYVTGCTTSICTTNNLIWTWIAVGIWASVPVFATGITTIMHGKAPATLKPCLGMMVFLCAFLFCPALAVISGVEVWKGINIFYQPPPQLWQGVPLPSGASSDMVKFFVPAVIGAIGIIEMIMMVAFLIGLCCSGCCGWYGCGGGKGCGGCSGGGCGIGCGSCQGGSGGCGSCGGCSGGCGGCSGGCGGCGQGCGGCNGAGCHGCDCCCHGNMGSTEQLVVDWSKTGATAQMPTAKQMKCNHSFSPVVAPPVSVPTIYPSVPSQAVYPSVPSHAVCSNQRPAYIPGPIIPLPQSAEPIPTIYPVSAVVDIKCAKKKKKKDGEHVMNPSPQTAVWNMDSSNTFVYCKVPRPIPGAVMPSSPIPVSCVPPPEYTNRQIAFGNLNSVQPFMVPGVGPSYIQAIQVRPYQ